jgi:DNA-binding NtrC family response regulator
VPEVDRRLLSYLEQHDWPGNVRQLKNCLESMLVMSPASRLTMEDLPPRLFLIQRRGKQAQIPVGMTLEKIERAAIEGALIHFNGDRRRAARSLGLARRARPGGLPGMSPQRHVLFRRGSLKSA